MVDSIHVARWLQQFAGEPFEFILFPSTPNRRVHPQIQALIDAEAGPLRVRIAGGMRRKSLIAGVLDLAVGQRIKGLLLRRVLRDEHPEVIHVLEFQHGGYLLLRAVGDDKLACPLIVTNWGSDVFWFMRFDSHRRRIERLLSMADFYSAECVRDWALARELGFRGECLPVIPNAGGLDIAPLRMKADRVAPSQRRRIMVKGYSGFVGLAREALAAVETAAPALQDFEVCVYSASVETTIRAALLRRRTGLRIRVFRKHALSHPEMLDLFASARVYLGMSKSDGISTSLLEAIASGCFPIQTGTACADEWITDGETGFILGSFDPEVAADCLTRACSDDDLVDSAFPRLQAIAEDRIDRVSIGAVARTYYDSALSGR